jgi:hypothetical protein
MNRSSKRCWECERGRRRAGTAVVASEAIAPVTLAEDKRRRHQKTEHDGLRRRYQEALQTIDQQERELNVVKELGTANSSFVIEPRGASKVRGEGTVVMVASDWHIEEKVGAEVGGLNEFSPDIAKRRTTRFFQSGLRLTQLLGKDINVTTIVLALLGDFITNELHGAESAERNHMEPTIALVTAQSFIVSGIEFLLKNSDYNLVIPCHSGNHARTTLKTRFSAENGHSLEYLMFCFLVSHFRDNPRVQFIVPEGMHSYLQIYDVAVRFHHGHSIRYAGGVGGIYIPTNKAIAQWNKGRHADLDVFGHFHQLRDGGNFICNGSLIGYNAFALSIKADYEKPRQALFLIDSRRGRTCTWPILLDEVKKTA